MKEIFKRIKNKKWDWCELKKLEKRIEKYGIVFFQDGYRRFISIADLLANQSFCKALWGERWTVHARIAFNILLIEGQDQALDYMIKTAI